jgi:hypothetical protein
MAEARANRSEEAIKSQADEQRLTRAVSIGLPSLTLATALGTGLVLGPAPSILVLAAGLLLGVIALFWGSLRVLSGDAPLAPELEALDMAAQGVDALASRKKMLLRALKDLEVERGLGKLEDEDYAAVSATYRAELKALLRRIDESLEPHRARAEDALRAHLTRVGLGDPLATDPVKSASTADSADEPDSPFRLECPECQASNEPDARFCKGCGSTLSPEEHSDAP